MEEVTVRTFSGDVCAPLSEEIRSALIALIGVRWVDVQPELSEEDWAEFQRLCMAESPDYYAFFTYSMFRGGSSGERFHCELLFPDASDS